MNYKMIIAYDGTRYRGWQKLGDTPDTIQEKIETVFEKLTGIRPDIHGAGRTDAGVHARGQCAQFRLPDLIPERVRIAVAPFYDEENKTAFREEPAPGSPAFCEALRRALNRYLPDDIGILSVDPAPERFHSRYHALGKRYVYRLTRDLSRHVFDRRYITRWETPLDAAAMRKAASHLIGTHDFKSFCGNPHFKKSTVRTLTSVTVEEDGPDIVITYIGEGFLQYMVRIMTGTLLEAGEGKRDPDGIPSVFDAKDRRAAGKTAPPEGLTLEEIYY